MPKDEELLCTLINTVLQFNLVCANVTLYE